MKAYRIKNDIVAAADPAAAIAVFAEHHGVPYNSAGSVEEVPLTLEVEIENEDATFRTGTIAELMPPDGAPAQWLAGGECNCCG